jgi:hypothetical protein
LAEVVARPPSSQHLEALEGRVGLGNGAGLIDAEHIDARQTLHRGQLAGEDVPPGEGDGRHGEGDARQQHEPLRHHSYHSGDCVRHALLHGGSHAELRPHQERSHGDDRRPYYPQDVVDALYQVGVEAHIALALAHHALRVRIGTHGRGSEQAAPGDHEAAGQQRVARLLDHRQGFTGQ